MQSLFETLQPGFSVGGPLRSILPEALIGPLQAPLTSRCASPLSDHSAQAFPNSGTSSTYTDDAYWMLEALKTSLLGAGISNPNPAIGCVLVDTEGKEISRGFTHAYRGIHAEKDAFQRASDSRALEGATAYITLEPCSHTGNQPPCVDLLLHSPIKRVVISRLDTDPRVQGKGVQKLRDSGKQVDVGLYSAESTAANFSFFAYQSLKRPVCSLKWAQTLDGQLADDSHRSQWISGPASRAYTHALRQRHDAILIGAKTLLSDLPQLNVRDCLRPEQNQPIPIILDPRGLCFQADLKTQKALLNSTFSPGRKVILITAELAATQNTNSWLTQNQSISIFRIPAVQIVQEVMALLRSLEIEALLGRRLQSIFVEGGAQTLTLFMKAGYADLLHTFVAPILTGGRDHRIELEMSLSEAKRWKRISSFALGDDLVFEMTTPPLFEQLFKSRGESGDT